MSKNKKIAAGLFILAGFLGASAYLMPWLKASETPEGGLTCEQICSQKREGREQRLKEQADELGITVEELKEQMDENREEMHDKWMEEAASILGMTSDELKAELEDGKKIFEILEEKGISHEDFHEQMFEKMSQLRQEHLREMGFSDEQIQEMENKMGGERPPMGFGPRGGFHKFGEF